MSLNWLYISTAHRGAVQEGTGVSEPSERYPWLINLLVFRTRIVADNGASQPRGCALRAYPWLLPCTAPRCKAIERHHAGATWEEFNATDDYLYRIERSTYGTDHAGVRWTGLARARDSPRSAGRDAVQIAIAAQVELVVHQRRRGVEPIVEHVGRQHLEARSVADDERHPVAAGDVHTALRSDR